MLEERSHPDLKRWGFLFTEALLIVASIMLAFALDSWWDERKERVEEAEILHGLKEEFVLNRSKLESRIDQHTEDLQALEELLVAANLGRWNSQEITFDRGIAALVAPPTTDLGNGVLDALISSGRFELLQNRELRIRLAAWAGVFGEAHDDEVMSRKFVFDQVIPKLIESGVPLSSAMGQWPDIEFLQRRSLTDDPEAFTRLLQDPGWAVLLEARLGYKMHTTGEYQAALDAVDGILAEIDRSMAQLGSQ